MSTTKHGGAFWGSLGGDVSRLGQVVRADVLDAWFPPAPAVLGALKEHALELCRTSPDVDGAPLRAAISRARGIPEESILVGSGSSSLIFLAMPSVVRQCATALVIDPSYGEYVGLLQSGNEAIGTPVPVHFLSLDRASGFGLDPNRLVGAPGDLVILVNPNSPAGTFVGKSLLLPVVEELSQRRVVWVDETYIEYAGSAESLETLAATCENVIVCKSMSKVYALSGLRVAYLVAHPKRIRRLAELSPPWPVSLPAQICGALALKETDYYSARYRETAQLRAALATSLKELGLGVTEGRINSVLAHLPLDGPTADLVRQRCERRGVYVRDASSMGTTMGTRTLRIAVRHSREAARILRTLGDSVGSRH